MAIKRLFDIVFSALGLLILSPAFLVISFLMWRQHNGPIFFRQERIGYKARPFTIFKFRTMSKVFEQEGPRLVAHSDISSSTPLEKFLRTHHLDELPQLWNVLRGDMSFVGPRPERKFYIDQIMAVDPAYTRIYEMRPGVTSEATLYNGYTDTMEKMIRRLHMDIDYLERRSLWLDLKIIVKTALNVGSGKKF